MGRFRVESRARVKLLAEAEVIRISDILADQFRGDPEIEKRIVALASGNGIPDRRDYAVVLRMARQRTPQTNRLRSQPTGCDSE
jgi:hypothetical protein